MALVGMQLQSFVDTLERQYPVRLVTNETSRTIQLDLIMVDEDSRRNGIGRHVMECLINYSENSRKAIELHPSSQFGTKRRHLKKFYKSLGFKSSNSKIYTMIRKIN